MCSPGPAARTPRRPRPAPTPDLTWSVGTIQGGSATAIVPDSCRLAVDRRLLPGETGAEAVRQVEAVLRELALERDGLSATATLVMEMPGCELAGEYPLVRTVRAATVGSGGADVAPAGWTAACDGGFLAADAGIPTVVLSLGSVLNEAHRADELVELTELDLAARTLALTVARLLPARSSERAATGPSTRQE